MRPPATLPGLDLPPVTPVKRRIVKPRTAAARVKKGRRVEHDLVELHEAAGIPAARVRASGALAHKFGHHFCGDLKVWFLGSSAPPLVGEIKSRAGGAGFQTLSRWLAENDLLVLKQNGAQPMIVLPWATWVQVLQAVRP